MKVAGIAIVVLALVIGIVPQLTECKTGMALASGMTAPMKCHWTAQAALGLAIPIAAVGALLASGRRRESFRNLGIVAMGLGAVTVLLPTVLIGVCASPMMLCNSVMQPVLILAGTLLAAAGLVTVVGAQRRLELAV
jgi:hypothetical protein